MKIQLIACLSCIAACLSLAGGELVVGPGALSPQEALLKIRAAKARGNREAWTVHVKPGLAALKEPLVFLPQDSGEPGRPVVWTGAGEGATLSGGIELTGWRDEGKGVWSAAAPRDAKGRPVWFEALFVNGRRARRARLPAQGSFQPVAVSQQPKAGGGAEMEQTLTGRPQDLAPLASAPAAELAFGQLVVRHKWCESRRAIRGFDAATGTLKLQGDEWKKWAAWDTKSAYFFENVRAGFTAPGDWFYDVPAGRVLYRPRAGEQLTGGRPPARFVAPAAKLPRLVELRGDPVKGGFVHDLEFRGLGFACSDVPGGAAGPSQRGPVQAAQDQDAAVTANGARHVVFADCRFAHTGNYGLWLRVGCMSNTVARCVFEDLGAGGVRIGAAGDVRGSELAPRGRRKAVTAFRPASTAFNTVEDCVIRGGGRSAADGVGVLIGHASDDVIVHNDISDLYYSGVSAGWAWGYNGSVAQRNTIAFNRIHKIGQGQLADLGGVYLLGTAFGTCVSNNVIFDVDAVNYGGWGLYDDEGSEGLVLENNLVYDTYDGSFHQHYGAGNKVRNNIFCFNRAKAAVRAEREVVDGVRSSFDFEHNIIYAGGGDLVARATLKIDGAWRDNLWYAPRSRAGAFGGLKLAAWAKARHETGSRMADPGFVDAAKRDFRLRPDSPALALGFRPFDFSQAGVRGAMRRFLAAP